MSHVGACGSVCRTTRFWTKDVCVCVCVCDPVHYLVAVPRMSSALKLAGKREVNVQIGPIDAVIGPF